MKKYQNSILKNHIKNLKQKELFTHFIQFLGTKAPWKHQRLSTALLTLMRALCHKPADALISHSSFRAKLILYATVKRLKPSLESTIYILSFAIR